MQTSVSLRVSVGGYKHEGHGMEGRFLYKHCRDHIFQRRTSRGQYTEMCLDHPGVQIRLGREGEWVSGMQMLRAIHPLTLNTGVRFRVDGEHVTAPLVGRFLSVDGQYVFEKHDGTRMDLTPSDHTLEVKLGAREWLKDTGLWCTLESEFLISDCCTGARECTPAAAS